MIYRAHFWVALFGLGLGGLRGPLGCGSASPHAVPVSVRENPASYTPHYSPRYSGTSSSGGGWSSGK